MFSKSAHDHVEYAMAHASVASASLPVEGAASEFSQDVASAVTHAAIPP